MGRRQRKKDTEAQNEWPDLDMSGLDSLEIGELDFDIDLDMDLSFSFDDGSRYISPRCKRMKSSMITYDNAIALAKRIDLEGDGRYDVVVSGDFIFGDFLEAYLTTRNIRCRKRTISTLSLSQNNVDSLKNLLAGGYVDELYDTIKLKT